jgi:hypothetical protein
VLFLSMVFHELTANAAKYGALMVADGRIAVTWALSGDPLDELQIVWAERGGPKTAGLRKRGFGTELIERASHTKPRARRRSPSSMAASNGASRCRRNPACSASRGWRERSEGPWQSRSKE